MRRAGNRSWEEWREMVAFCGGDLDMICPRWRHKFKNFHQDMGDVPRGARLLRHGIHEVFCKENCYWG